MLRVGLSDVGVVVLYGDFSVAVGASNGHVNLPQHYKLICYEPALCTLEEVIEALLLELFGIPGTRYGSAEPDVLFEVFVG